MSKQDLSFSVSSHITHPDNQEAIDIHTWNIYLAEYSTNNFTVFCTYSLNTLEPVEGKEGRQVTSMRSEDKFSKTYSDLEEAKYNFNILTLKGFTALRGEATINIERVEVQKCLISE